MKYNNAALALSVLMLLSLNSMQAGVRRTIKDTATKTRNLAVTQVQGALSAVARGADTLLYPAAVYWVGCKLYDNQVKQSLPGAPQLYKDVEGMVPYGNQATDLLVRLVTGCLAVAGVHALVTTETVGSFVDTNMPHLARLFNHIGAENGLKNKKYDGKCGL